MKRKRLSKQERQRVYEKYGGRCAYCGQPITYNEMQVEHMEPLALGGPDSPENRVPSCRICNHYKHTLTVEGFRQQLDRITVRLQAREYTYKLAIRHRRITENETPVKFYFEKVGENATTGERLEAEQHDILQELRAKLDETLYHEPADSGSVDEDNIWKQANDLMSLLNDFFGEGKADD